MHFAFWTAIKDVKIMLCMYKQLREHSAHFFLKNLQLKLEIDSHFKFHPGSEMIVQIILQVFEIDRIDARFGAKNDKKLLFVQSRLNSVSTHGDRNGKKYISP